MGTPVSQHPAQGPPPSECDVAIVGYGPVGQALACLLGQAGHRVSVFERHASIYPLPRAVHLDHEVMRILQALGVAHELSPRLFPITSYQWFGADGDPIFTMRSPTPARSGWEPDYMFFQPELEQALDDAARSQPTVEVHRGWTAEGADQDDAVALTLSGSDGAQTHTIRARYLIGADGANSSVREACAIATRDLGFREQWLVVDVLPDDLGALARLPDACQWCDPRRPHMHARNGRRHRRWEFMLLPGEDPSEFAEAGRVWELLAPFVTPAEGTLTRHAVYEFRSTLAERMRAGKVLLAGDAAHLTPPFLGQGMCAGLRDAINIAWKLDLVLRGDAPDALLDTIEGERQAQTEALIALAVELGRVSCELDPAAAAERDAALRAAGELPPPEPLPLGGELISAAPGCQTLAGQLAVQGRLEMDGREGLLDDLVGRGFTLIAAEDPLAELAPEQIERLRALDFRFVSLADTKDLDGRLSAWMDTHGAGAVIIRPDFYVFGAADRPAALPALVEELLRSISKTKEKVLDAR
jgi:2-polyprenyl-6-methoxyphenol hydroxylase-like FAD-dependent oxidoreductase